MSGRQFGLKNWWELKLPLLAWMLLFGADYLLATGNRMAADVVAIAA